MISKFLDNYDILIKSILFFMSICYLLNQYKPNIMFDENGDYKSFGNGSKKNNFTLLVSNKMFCNIILFIFSS